MTDSAEYGIRPPESPLLVIHGSLLDATAAAHAQRDAGCDVEIVKIVTVATYKGRT